MPEFKIYLSLYSVTGGQGSYYSSSKPTALCLCQRYSRFWDSESKGECMSVGISEYWYLK